MQNVTFQVLAGVDKGRVFRDMPIPVTIGREEGNLLRLNDERVSRFHAKVQQDKGDIILTDLESTNGTRVNGSNVQIRRLRPGDRVGIGRSLLLYGSNEEIAGRMATLQSKAKSVRGGPGGTSPLIPDLTTAQTLLPEFDEEGELHLDPNSEITVADGELFLGPHVLPPLPQKLSPAQAARLAEILDFLHRGLTNATDNLQANEEGTQIKISYADWQKIQAVQMLLARYLRAVAEPETLEE